MRKAAAQSDRLGKKVVDDLEPGDARFTVWDTELRGFGVRISPEGLKTYLVRYRVGGGRGGVLRQQVLGRHGKVTAEEARKDAKAILNAAERGKDPQAEKAAARAALTVAELCDLYVREGATTNKAKTLEADKSRIKWHIKPLIGSVKINRLTKTDVERLVREIAAGKTATEAAPHVKGGKPSATRTLALLRSILTFAIGRKMIAESPAKGVKSFKPVKRERFLSPKEMGALGDAMAAMEKEGRPPKVALDVIRLLALTGARRNEIARLRWSEVDIGRSLLRLDDSKTGQKVIALGAAAVALVAQLPKSNFDYVFAQPGEPHTYFRGLFYAWELVRERAGLPGVRIHDLRHSFASAGLASGQALALIGKLLGHSKVTTTARYAHLADDPLRAAADQISETISNAMGRLKAVDGQSGSRVQEDDAA